MVKQFCRSAQAPGWYWKLEPSQSISLQSSKAVAVVKRAAKRGEYERPPLGRSSHHAKGKISQKRIDSGKNALLLAHEWHVQDLPADSLGIGKTLLERVVQRWPGGFVLLLGRRRVG